MSAFLIYLNEHERLKSKMLSRLYLAFLIFYNYAAYFVMDFGKRVTCPTYCTVCPAIVLTSAL